MASFTSTEAAWTNLIGISYVIIPFSSSSHISSNYAKIWGETNFHPREFPRNGSKAIGVEEREREEEEERKKEKNSRRKQWPALLRPPPRVAPASMPGPTLLGPFIK